jgi:hypothetical protein
VSWTTEDSEQLAFLLAPVGETDSGRIRYAAAMHFNRRAMLSHDALEIFRILAKEDGTDPAPVLASHRLIHEIDTLKTGYRT